MKQWIRSLMLLFLLSTPSFLFADTLSLTTYYPAPFGSYSLLRLNPVTDASMGACDGTKTGQIYLSSDSSELKLCTGTTWNSVGPWMLNAAAKYVYQPHSITDTAYKIGIGLAAPTARLHVRGVNDATYGQLLIDSTESDAKITLNNASGGISTGRANIVMSNTAGSEGLRFMINNTDKMILDENGNVGVGLTAPNTNLHITGVDNATYGQLEIQSTGNDARLSLYNANGTSATGRGDIMMSRTANSEGLRFLINGTDRMIVDENGNVGIGLTAPTELLSLRKDQSGVATSLRIANVNTTANSIARLDLLTGTAGSNALVDLQEVGGGSSLSLSTGDGVTGGLYLISGSTATNIPIVFRQGATDRMRVHSTGNVGIGVQVPTQKLDVGGALHLSGPISGNIDSATPAASGTLRVDCSSSPGNCYAVYAP